MSNNTRLSIQRYLFSKLNNNIITTIEKDAFGNTWLMAKNINSDDINNIELVTNNPSFFGPPLVYKDIDVYLGDNLFPTLVHGLLEITKTNMRNSQTESFLNSTNTYKPFYNNFTLGNNNTIVSINDIVDLFSTTTSDIPDTYNIKKMYTLKFVLQE
jgi:hypothetical protein